ncbi:hypothetical protein SLEP1_g24988 [Rubroshorea leprosula]|uniref:Uncharacterized protein n=1 Tax=Rubroshorea leprosula TaxID=152421 RepID=A0AAV5JHC1_9ROSI|nr:hypothetical protein SLEP1_g24988 [Rubroshorea leprosula]
MDGEKKNVPSISKGLLQSEELYQYILETSVYPREPEPLKELRDVTARHPRAGMGTAPDAGQLMALLLNLVDAKRTIEIGVFTVLKTVKILKQACMQVNHLDLQSRRQ